MTSPGGSEDEAEVETGGIAEVKRRSKESVEASSHGWLDKGIAEVHRQPLEGAHEGIHSVN